MSLPFATSSPTVTFSAAFAPCPSSSDRAIASSTALDAVQTAIRAGDGVAIVAEPEGEVSPLSSFANFGGCSPSLRCLRLHRLFPDVGLPKTVVAVATTSNFSVVLAFSLAVKEEFRLLPFGALSGLPSKAAAVASPPVVKGILMMFNFASAAEATDLTSPVVFPLCPAVGGGFLLLLSAAASSSAAFMLGLPLSTAAAAFSSPVEEEITSPPLSPLLVEGCSL
mmetsp:Transcript_26246/g.55813  ORF Transcript_26246/g.55813 Transcript_26246/m.55813 type:complete len:224 (-) Transcript_26246:581-1252(-)